MKITTLLLITFLTLPFAVNAQDNFTFCYDPYPPFTLGKTGTPTGGLKVQLINAVFNELDNVNVDVILLPWKQCQKQAELGKVDGILPLFKNEQRATYLEFSDSAFDQVSAFWYNRSRYPDGIEWQDFSDLKTLKLGMLIGGFIDKEMEETFEASTGIHRGKSVENLFQVLIKDRVDLIAIDDGVGRYIVKENGWEDDVAIVKKPIGLKQSYIGLSKKSKVVLLRDPINQALEKLRADGTLKRIRESTDY